MVVWKENIRAKENPGASADSKCCLRFWSC